MMSIDDSATLENSCHEYWDGGVKKLRVYLKQHTDSACENNWICQALNLLEIDVELEEEKTAASPKLQVADKSQKRKRIGSPFLVNDNLDRDSLAD